MGGAQHVNNIHKKKVKKTDQKLFFPKSKLVYISPSNVITTLTTAINHCTNIIYIYTIV